MSATAPPPEESPTELFRALVRLHAEGKIALELDFKRLHHMDCPVAVEADSNLLAYGIVAASLFALWRGGWWVALAVAALGVALYFSVGQAYVRRRIRRRIAERALNDRDLWQKLWRFGGVTLVPQAGGACAAPQGNWMALVRSVRAEGQ
jgi:hypothetical protein